MVRYIGLGRVELNVSQLSRSKDFYQEAVGLQLVNSDSAIEARFKCTGDEFGLVLHEAAQPGFKRVGWLLESEIEFDRLYERLASNAIPYEDVSSEECAERKFGRACRIREPNTSAVFEFYVNPPNASNVPFRGKLARIVGLGHVVFASPNAAAAWKFLREVLNFKVSDSIGEAITFMRPFPNPYHHGIGVAQSERLHFHHLNFMTSEIDDIGKAIHRFRRLGVETVYGPGRHPASGSVFLYFLDPDNLTLEYSFGMEEFAEVDPREGRLLPLKPESIDYWGAVPDPRMSKTGEIEGAALSVLRQ